MVSGTQDNPPPRATLAELTFHLFLRKIQLTVYMRMRTRLWGGGGGGGKTTRVGELSCLGR